MTNYSIYTAPTVDVSINKSRVKRYTVSSKPSYYLQDGQEFQLELFNPTDKTIAADILINGQSEQQGHLVIRPGQRIFLDRYLGSPKKFKFTTYEVGNTKEINNAIKNNGNISVLFYNEIVYDNTISYQPYSYQPYTYTTHVYDGTTSTTAGTNISSLIGGSSFYTTSCGVNTTLTNTKKQKTGIIEKGGLSDQQFTNVDLVFSTIPFHTAELKLLPISARLIEATDLNVARYCTNCGKKINHTHKYCSNCGVKL